MSDLYLLAGAALLLVLVGLWVGARRRKALRRPEETGDTYPMW
jgi:LPXTG-motif cell wall-anchored protein